MDKLVQELETIVKSRDWSPHWNSSEKRIRCFLHVLNLVSQSLLRQFDAPKKKTGAGIGGFRVNTERESGDVDAQTEAELAATSLDKDPRTDLREGDDDDEGLVDEIKQMPRAEAEKVQRETKPVRLAIAKVRKTFSRAWFELIAPRHYYLLKISGVVSGFIYPGLTPMGYGVCDSARNSCARLRT